MPAPQLPPFTPVFYQPDSQGRYRLYPQQATAQIPGTGYDVGQTMWAEQELNLQGAAKAPHYGDYEQVPLRGLGALNAPFDPRFAMSRISPALLAAYRAPETEASVFETDVNTLLTESADDAPPVDPPEVPQEGFFDKKWGPVPVWAVAAGGGALVLGLGGYFIFRK